MDASAYLQKQGWRGDGHSLDHTDRGIKKPLLVSKKVDVLGVGLNKHQAVSDQWWLRAFDQGLKTFGTGKESALGAVQKHGVNRGGLYARFVQGEGVPGSIGQSPVPGSEESTRVATPVDSQQELQDTMAIDIPPEAKLEKTIRKFNDKNHHDAMMHLLQNPDDAPPGMQKMLDKKRKRAEQPGEKRARRKMERNEKSRENAQENRRKAKEEGTWDEEQEQKRKEEKRINKQADGYVLEAQRRGIIPLGPNEIRKGLVPTGANAEVMQQDEPSQDFVAIISRAGMDPRSPFVSSGKQSEKAQKYTREKMKREVKRAAKSYLTGEKSPNEQTAEERRAAKAEEKVRRAEKRAAAVQKDAEKMANREERAEKKKQARAARKAEKEQIAKAMAENAVNGLHHDQHSLNGDAQEHNAAKFDTGADEVKFGISSTGGLKTIPGVGPVGRYPTKAEKKAKKLAALAVKEGVTEDVIKQRVAAEQSQKLAEERLKVDRYRAMKHGMSLEEYQTAVAEGKVYTPKVEKKNLPPEKLAEYAKRAQQKGISVEEYIRRREEKYAAKQAEKLGNPYQDEMIDAANAGDGVLRYQPDLQSRAKAAPAPDADGLGFVVDTAGDESLAVKAHSTSADGPLLAMVDTEGDASYTANSSHMPIPLDPRVWEGINPKDMPKPMRKARQQWMKQRREERKARKLGEQAPKPLKKPKGQRKVEARENFVKQILFHSRKALIAGTNLNNDTAVTIEGVEGVPLVKLQSREGIFKKDEVALARTVARRVLRNVKREEKAKKGKGKGSKKRERSAKEAARNAGISGFTDRARLDPTYKGNGQRALLA